MPSLLLMTEIAPVAADALYSTPRAHQVPVMLGPNITGTSFGEHPDNDVGKTWTGAFSLPREEGYLGSGASDRDNARAHFSAAKSNSVYGGASTVQPRSLTGQLLIKY